MIDENFKQRGFTLIEVMASMTLGLLLMSIIGAIYFSTVRSAEQIYSRIAMNQAAREMFDILANGGYKSGMNTTNSTITDPTTDNHNYIFGLNGRVFSSLPITAGWAIPSSLMVKNSQGASNSETYMLGLSPNGDDPEIGSSGTSVANSPIMSSETSAESTAGIDVVCSTSESDNPVEFCAMGETRHIRGYLRGDVDLSRDTDAKTLHATLLLINPMMYNLKENKNNTEITDSNVFDTYWSAFLPMAEVHP